MSIYASEFVKKVLDHRYLCYPSYGFHRVFKWAERQIQWFSQQNHRPSASEGRL